MLEGELEFPTGSGQSMHAPVGSMVIAPPGVVHAFPRTVSERARFLNVHAPGGFHRTLGEILEVRSKGQEPSAELRERHDGFPVAWREPGETGDPA